MKNQKGISSIVIILFVVGVLAVAGGVYYFVVQKPSQPEQPVLPPKLDEKPVTPTKPEEIQPSPTDETANWKTYRNEDYGFEIKYPENFVIRESYFPEQEDKLIIVRFLTPEQTEIPKESAFQSSFLSIWAKKVDSKMRLEDWLKEHMKRSLFSKIKPGHKASSCKEAFEKFDDVYYFDKVTVGEGISGYLIHFCGKWGVSYIYIKHEDTLIEFTSHEPWGKGDEIIRHDYTFFLEHPIASKMLRSFKFLKEK